jgi:hypothetical protein
MEVRTEIFFRERIPIVLLLKILMKTLHVRIFCQGYLGKVLLMKEDCIHFQMFLLLTKLASSIQSKMELLYLLKYIYTK